MKTIIYLFFPLVALFLFTSCHKNEEDNLTIVICPVTFTSIFTWQEDSINVGKTGIYSEIGDGQVFTWLSSYGTLDKSQFGIYEDLSNIKTDFVYAIVPDSVFTFRLTADSVYFYDKGNNVRTDLKGHITYTPDTSLVLFNTAVSPAITIKYKLAQ